MRKFALLLAAAVILSAPVLVAGMSTDTYAAAKAKKAAKGGKAGKEVKVDPNGAFLMALGDLFNSLGQPWPAQTSKAATKSGTKSAKKAKKA
jgi:hypothetical protein